MTCPHPTFDALVTVNRLEDVIAFTADVRIHCTACGEPFAFIGCPTGLSSAGPTTSVDGRELHVPIRPSSSDAVVDWPGFSVHADRRSDA